MTIKLLLSLIVLFLPLSAYSMHIMEGFLPPFWAGFYWIIFLPFLISGLRKIKILTVSNSKLKLLLAMAGAFAFILSALKLPSLTGSSSHATGVGLGTIIFGPSVMFVLGFIVLIFQALLLAHGGLTTLGANSISMAVIGPFITYGMMLIGRKFHFNRSVLIFIAAFSGNISTYTATSFQLAMAHPDSSSGFLGSFYQFLSVFALTQIPLAAVEGLLTVIIINILAKNANEEISSLEGGLF